MKVHHAVFFQVQGNTETWLSYRTTESQKTPWQPAGTRQEGAPRCGKAMTQPYRFDAEGRPLFGVRLVDPDRIPMLQDTPAFAPLNMEFLGKELESIKTRVEKLPHGIWQWYFPPDTIKPNKAFFRKSSPTCP
eukprot:jgi/Mesvir1/21702/Mv04121-RA.1